MSGSSAWLDTAGLVGWSSLLATGLLGLSLDYDRPEAPREHPPLPPAQLIDVDLVAVPEAELPPLALSEAPDPSLALPPAPLQHAAPQAAPELVAVADPSAVAFALPVEGPVRQVAAAQASYRGRRGTGDGEVEGGFGGPVETLVFGQGQGAQPAPQYPWTAVKQGQEGAVRVVFCVGRDGRVSAAEVAGPCPWSLLNESALRTVLHRWRFAAGALRRYEVVIQFELEK